MLSGMSKGRINFSSKPDSVHRYAPMMIDVKSRHNNLTASFSNVSLSNVTYTELDLFQQCLERVIVQSQFRAYLSKFLVLGSTGHFSWCFFYEQKFTTEESFKRVKVMLITNSDFNDIWNRFSTAVQQHGCSFFLTNHGEAIIDTLRRSCDNINLHAVRVHLSN
jgi:hypothetical protein